MCKELIEAVPQWWYTFQGLSLMPSEQQLINKHICSAFIILFLMYECFYLLVCMCPGVCLVHGGQKVLDPLELEVETV